MTDKPPRSERQVGASRANGSKSRGPVSPEGKVKSAENSRTHGLTGKVSPSNEEQDELDRLLSALRVRYQVEDPAQLILIDRATAATLRLKRARELITQVLEDIAEPKNPRRTENLRSAEQAIDNIQANIKHLLGKEPARRSWAKLIAEQEGALPDIPRPNRSTLGKLMGYAQRFRGERDRALMRLEAMRTMTNAKEAATN